MKISVWRTKKSGIICLVDEKLRKLRTLVDLFGRFHKKIIDFRNSKKKNIGIDVLHLRHDVVSGLASICCWLSTPTRCRSNARTRSSGGSRGHSSFLSGGVSIFPSFSVTVFVFGSCNSCDIFVVLLSRRSTANRHVLHFPRFLFVCFLHVSVHQL